MRISRLVVLPSCLLAFAVAAQTTVPSASRLNDRWAPPAPAASVAAAHGQALPGDDAAAAKPSPFKFKSARKTWEPEPPPPRANDKAAVMGTQRAWVGGKPPVSCAQTPQDPACR